MKSGFAALIGRPNVGKSTLMKVLTGIYTKDSGSIIYEGKEIESEENASMLILGFTIKEKRLEKNLTQKPQSKTRENHSKILVKTLTNTENTCIM